MGDDEVLDLLRIDVHAAGNDHEALAVGEIEIAVRIDLPDIAQRRPAMLVGGGRRLLGVVMIGERRAVREIDHAFLPDRYLVAVLVADVDHADQRAPDRALALEPFLRGDQRESVAFGAGIIFHQHRAPPGDHRLFHGNRARRRRMDRAAQRRDVVALAHLLRQFQHAREMGRHPLRAVRAMVFDEPERRFRIELLHHDHRAAETMHDHAPAQRRGMIERRRGQIDAVLAEAEGVLRERGQRIRRIDRLAGQFALHALRSAGRAGGIEHVLARALVADRRRLLFRAHRAEILVDAKTAVQRIKHEIRERLGQRIGDRPLRGGGDEKFRAAIAHDVLDLSGGEVGGNAGVVEPRALRRPGDLEIARMILDAQRDAVAGLQAERAEQLRALVRPFVELGVGDRLAGRRHDHGRLVRIGACVMRGMLAHRSS